MAQAPSPEDLTDIVAIDGPAGAGKSTVARMVARRLNYAFLDTGAMYRAATWWALHNGVDLHDPEALIAATKSMHYKVRVEDGDQRIFVGEHDVTHAIRSQEVTREIHRLDQIPEVRAQLVALQRKMAAPQPTVAEGRDMGTVVFPTAKCKVFLEASIDERTRRRADELEQKGHTVDREQLRQAIARRDEQNRTRAVAPLRPAEDAVIIDTTHMTLDEVVDKIVNLSEQTA